MALAKTQITFYHTRGEHGNYNTANAVGGEIEIKTIDDLLIATGESGDDHDDTVIIGPVTRTLL